MKTKLTYICLALMAGMVLTMTACGNANTSSIAISEMASKVDSNPPDNFVGDESAVESETVPSAAPNETPDQPTGTNNENNAGGNNNTNTPTKGEATTNTTNGSNNNTGGGTNNHTGGGNVA